MKCLNLILALILFSSCASHQSKILSAKLDQTKHEELKLDVPFVAQKEKHCGPTSLYMLLNNNNSEISYDQIVAMTFSPGADGAYKNDMLAAMRRLGYAPYKVALENIPAALEQKLPILIFQNLALGWNPLWHYSVVVGFSRERQLFYVHNGEEAYSEMTIKRLTHTWERGGKWSYVVTPPHQIPFFASHEEAIQNAIIFERIQLLETAKTLYQNIARRWPKRFEAYIGLASTAYAQQEYQQAIIYSKKALRLNPNNPYLYSNLAHFYQLINQPELALDAKKNAERLMLAQRTASQ